MHEPASDSPASDPSPLTPVAPRERIATLDVLRGFALCGVLIGNLFWLYSGRAWSGKPDDGALDVAASWFVMLVVQSKAQTLLTFLFGFGFAAQLLRAQRRGEPVMGLYVRRLVVLFAIGALHVALLWWGDVTWTYAVAGFGLLLFQHASNRARAVWAVILILVPFLLWTIPSIGKATMDLVTTPDEMRSQTQKFVAAMHDADYATMMWRHVVFAIVWEARIYTWYYPWLVGRFLLGYIAGTARWFDNDGVEHLAVFRTLLRYGLAVAVASLAMATAEQLDWVDAHALPLAARLAIHVLDQIGLLGQTAAYVAIVVLLMQRPAWRRMLLVIAPAGRMPLTTYVAQSVICTFLFYGWGLGWSGSVGAAGCLALAIAIFALEVVACHLWLRRFRFGPLEWLWRRLVYLRPQPMRG